MVRTQWYNENKTFFLANLEASAEAKKDCVKRGRAEMNESWLFCIVLVGCFEYRVW